MATTGVGVLKKLTFNRSISNCIHTRLPNYCSLKHNTAHYATFTPQTTMTIEDEEFRVLVIPGHSKEPEKKREARRSNFKTVPPPRSKQMRTDQDWTSVWPAAQTFKWSAVPFPVRQGVALGEENEGISPGKYANAELMKIPNFLHLTPNHIRKHCAALKDLCTPWPEGLETEADCQHHFPVETTTHDYVVDAPSLRDPRARTVTLQIKLSSLELDHHARDKLLRLVDNKYNTKTDVLTVVTDRCPLKQQNYDYAMYILTALYHESWKTEDWELGKTEADMEMYRWDTNPSKASVVDTVKLMKNLEPKAGEAKDSSVPDTVSSLPSEPSEDDIINLDAVQQFKDAVSDLHNEGENSYVLQKYRDSVVKLLLGNVELKS